MIIEIVVVTGIVVVLCVTYFCAKSLYNDLSPTLAPVAKKIMDEDIIKNFRDLI